MCLSGWEATRQNEDSGPATGGLCVLAKLPEGLTLYIAYIVYIAYNSY